MQLINKIIKDQKLFVYDLHKINAFGKRFQFNYEIDNDILYQECNEYGNPLFKAKLSENLGDDASALLKSLNKRRFLYADDAFVNIIYNHIENPHGHYRKLDILLLSEDVGCMDNIHKIFIHKYPNLSVTDITINKKMSEDRVQEAILKGLNSFDESFSITLMNPFKYVKKVINLSQL